MRINKIAILKIGRLLLNKMNHNILNIADYPNYKIKHKMIKSIINTRDDELDIMLINNLISHCFSEYYLSMYYKPRNFDQSEHIRLALPTWFLLEMQDVFKFSLK